MKIKVKAYNMSDVEVLSLMEKKYTLCRDLTPANYDYKPKYIHYLEDEFGKRLVITATSYKSVMKCINR